ncbi:hypothetical protein BsWGS_16629 [Bradybaena similaris]
MTFNPEENHKLCQQYWRTGLQDYSRDNADVSVNPSSVMLLTNGFISHFLPPLLKAQSSINQIRSSQSVLLETVQQESSKFIDCQAFTDLKDTMTKAKQYHNKLLKLRREMTDLHEKSKRLKKRALKLQQQRQKEELTRAHNLEKELEKERMLTARVASTQD